MILATNAVSERSFSALKGVKTYLRVTTPDSRLNNLMVLHVHKKETDNIDMVYVANRFVTDNDSRHRIFDRFTLADITPKASLNRQALRH